MHIDINIPAVEWWFVLTAVVFFLSGWAWSAVRNSNLRERTREEVKDSYRARIRAAHRCLAHIETSPDGEYGDWAKSAKAVIAGEDRYGCWGWPAEWYE